MAVFTYPPITAATVTGAATEAKQDDMITLLTSLDTKITKCDTDSITVVSTALPTGASTSALQTTGNASLSSIDGKITACNTGAVTISAALPAGTNNIGDVDIASSVLPTGASTAANQATGNASLSSIDGKIVTCNTGSVTVVSNALPTGASTSALQTSGNASLTAMASDINDLNSRLAGNLVPEAFDYIALTYVAAGNGIGEIETVIYKAGGAAGSTEATLTLAYDGDDNLSTVTKS